MDKPNSPIEESMVSSESERDFSDREDDVIAQQRIRQQAEIDEHALETVRSELVIGSEILNAPAVLEITNRRCEIDKALAGIRAEIKEQEAEEVSTDLDMRSAHFLDIAFRYPSEENNQKLKTAHDQALNKLKQLQEKLEARRAEIQQAAAVEYADFISKHRSNIQNTENSKTPKIPEEYAFKAMVENNKTVARLRKKLRNLKIKQIIFEWTFLSLFYYDILLKIKAEVKATEKELENNLNNTAFILSEEIETGVSVSDNAISLASNPVDEDDMEKGLSRSKRSLKSR